MLCISNAIYSLLFLCALASNGRKERPNEAECAARRCCMKRDEVPASDMLNVLCETLSDEECGEYDEYCIWDCHANDHQSVGKRGTSERHFSRISAMDGEYEEPLPGFQRGTNETFEECMSSGRTIERDDCGVEYEDIMDEDLLRQFCLGNQQYETTVGLHGTYPDMDVDDDNSTSSDRRRDVLGTDGRWEVPSTWSNYWPYRSVFYLEFNGYRCTASLISPYWAITAGHCVWGNGDWYSNWNLYKYVHSCSDCTSSNLFTVQYAVTFTAYINAASVDSKFSWDIAWLRVSQDAGNQLGYFGFGYDSGFSGTLYFSIISYPADKPDCQKYSQYCPYSEWDGDHQQVTYECDTYGGASGSPVYRYRSGYGQIVYAIHTNGACFDSNGQYQSVNVCNLATRITSSKFNAICGWVEIDTPNHCP